MEYLVLDSSKFLGPFLCRPGSTTMSFWFCLSVDSPAPEIKITDTTPTTKLHSVGQIAELFKIFIVEVNDLKPDTKYNYEVLLDKKKLIFSNEHDDDFSFKTLNESSNAEKDKFILMSCHGVDTYEDQNKKLYSTFNMWDNLLETINKDRDVRFGFLSGDQVYMDKPFGSYLSRRWRFKTGENIQKESLETYYRFWSNPSYRKVMARIPFFLMWDDHDLIDGWGSRKEAKSFFLKKKWIDYFSIQREFFYLMQACRNKIYEVIPENHFYTSFTHGNSTFLIPDLRSERDFEKKEMISKNQLELMKTDLSKSSLNNGFIISSVTMARMSGNMEKWIGRASDALWFVTSWSGYGPNFFKVLFWVALSIISFILFNNPTLTSGSSIISAYPLIGALILSTLFLYKKLPLPFTITALLTTIYGLHHIGAFTPGSYFKLALAFLGFGFLIFSILEAAGYIDEIAGLKDDLEDSWNSKTNTGNFNKLLDMISEFPKIRFTVLSGDIHTAGISQLIISENKKILKIPQVVASPITYTVMPVIMERLTSSAKAESIKHGDKRICTYNVMYRSKRNFCILKCSENIEAAFYFEDLEEPINFGNLHSL